MNGARIKWLALVFCFFLFSATSKAQLPTKKEKEAALALMAKLINDNYVFPEKGKKIAASLMQGYKSGIYDSVKTWKAFDSTATRQLQQASADGHMYVRYDPKTVKELAAVKVESKPGEYSEDPFFYGKDAVKNNFGFREVKVLDGNIGYIKLNEINISEKSLPILASAMEFIGNTDALIIDLQNNGGGGSAVGNVIQTYFLPKETPLMEFRMRGGQVNLAKTESWLTAKKYDKPLYILVNRGTFSAAEALAYQLQAVKRAVVVGQRSGGGANMNSWYPVNEHIFISVSTGAPTLPGKEENWEGKGVQPDYVVEEGKEIEQVKTLLARAADEAHK
jgi:hypothetical protein